MTARHRAKAAYRGDHVLTGCGLGDRVWLQGPSNGARKALGGEMPPGWAVKDRSTPPEVGSEQIAP